MTAGTLPAWPVADAQGLMGMIRRDDLEAAVTDGSGGAKLATLIAAPDSEGSNIPHVHPDHGLHMALDRIGASGLQALPVVSRANVRELFGVIVLDDILRAYGVEPVPEDRNGSNPHLHRTGPVERSLIEEDD
jgi:CBS domain-containing protein